MMYLNSTFFLCAILLPLLLPIPSPAAAAAVCYGRGEGDDERARVVAMGPPCVSSCLYESVDCDGME